MTIMSGSVMDNQLLLHLISEKDLIDYIKLRHTAECPVFILIIVAFSGAKTSPLLKFVVIGHYYGFYSELILNRFE